MGVTEAGLRLLILGHFRYDFILLFLFLGFFGMGLLLRCFSGVF